MVIEFLHFTVAPDQRQAFIARDAEVWTSGLAEQPGYLGKEVWVDLSDPSQVRLAIRWESREHWQAVPLALQQELDRRMGDLLRPVEGCDAFDVAGPAPAGP
jgi:uncharacterized protein (TIGR03792 family)